MSSVILCPLMSSSTPSYGTWKWEKIFYFLWHACKIPSHTLRLLSIIGQIKSFSPTEIRSRMCVESRRGRCHVELPTPNMMIYVKLFFPPLFFYINCQRQIEFLCWTLSSCMRDFSSLSRSSKCAHREKWVNVLMSHLKLIYGSNRAWSKGSEKNPSVDE